MSFVAPTRDSTTCAPIKVGNGEACFQCSSYSHFVVECLEKGNVDCNCEELHNLVSQDNNVKSDDHEHAAGMVMQAITSLEGYEEA